MVLSFPEASAYAVSKVKLPQQNTHERKKFPSSDSVLAVSFLLLNSHEPHWMTLNLQARNLMKKIKYQNASMSSISSPINIAQRVKGEPCALVRIPVNFFPILSLPKRTKRKKSRNATVIVTNSIKISKKNSKRKAFSFPASGQRQVLQKSWNSKIIPSCSAHNSTRNLQAAPTARIRCFQHL